MSSSGPPAGEVGGAIPELVLWVRGRSWGSEKRGRGEGLGHVGTGIPGLSGRAKVRRR